MSKLCGVGRCTVSSIVLNAAPRSPRGPLGVHALDSDVRVAEQARAEDHAADDAVLAGPLGKRHPVEVVVVPELGEVLFAAHDALLLGGVQSTAEDNTHLQPHGRGVTMR